MSIYKERDSSESIKKYEEKDIIYDFYNYVRCYVSLRTHGVYA